MREQHLTDLVVVEPGAEQLQRARQIGEQLLEDLLAIEVMTKGARPIGLARSASLHLCSTCSCCVPSPFA